MMRLSQLFFVLAVLSGSRAFAAPEWSALFEQQDLSEWDAYQINPARWSFVTMPTPPQGVYAARIELRKGDVPPFSQSQFRNDMTYTVNDTKMVGFNGTERYYGWSFRLPADTATNGLDLGRRYQVMFWESGEPVYSQAVNFELTAAPEGGKTVVTAKVNTQPQSGGYVERWKAALEVDRWYTFAMRLKWSPDATVGSMDLWVDGTKVVDNVKWANVHKKPDGSQTAMVWHHGIFTEAAADFSKNAVTLLDNVRAGQSLADLAPNQVATPDASVPAMDASIEVPDAGMGPVDSGIQAVVDSGKPAEPMRQDSGASMQGDAGVVARREETGCGCQGAGGASFAIYGLAFALLLARRRNGV